MKHTAMGPKQSREPEHNTTPRYPEAQAADGGAEASPSPTPLIVLCNYLPSVDGSAGGMEDAERLANALRALVDRERTGIAKIASRTDWPPGLLLPRTVWLAQLEAAATVLSAIGEWRTFVPIDTGDDVDVRCQVIEHYGDSLLVEFPSLRGRARAVVGPAAISQVLPRRRLVAG